MNKKLKIISIFILGLVCLIFFFKAEKTNKADKKITQMVASSPLMMDFSNDKNQQNSIRIDELTEEKRVIAYVKKYHHLPDYYITKSEARKLGWVASEGNLCDVLPGRAIGGDRFGNREKNLPTDAQYYEADVNYNCGRRGSDRIVFTQKGDVYLTKNHYKTFEKQ